MGLFDDIGKTLDNAFTDVSKALYGWDPKTGKIDIGNSLAKKGKDEELRFAGYDPKSGQWGGKGSAPSWIDEGFGAISGRNQSRAALNFAKDQAADAKKQAQDLVTQQQWQSQQNDLKASGQAQANNLTNASRNGVNYTNSTPLGANQNKDFLGL